ncbi:homoserine dehydrogenase [Thermogemmatispora sp.]|uniref:homoserine dehydrogenase n=1 Tax=Thermogemmatispora sp. TaxID=1968838 RepID=UPI001D6A861E|nr:homoserine dehydrogenase [Thermogemmatispora sp.]MBX5448997.1 homoserine dehydrogenase [Thermogemmatispora sp.]
MVKEMRLALIGFGTVGQGLAELLMEKREWLRAAYGLDARLVAVATARSGFLARAEGLDEAELLRLAASGQPLTAYTAPGMRHWPTVGEGLAATGADVLIEVTGTNLHDGEPGLSHIRQALEQGMHVITANKGPVALAAHELLALAARKGVQLRMEATVMAGTPVLSTLREGLAGARILGLSGILNGTTNYILTAMSQGRDYAEALAEAQRLGYAEADPTADVEGYDALAKTLILAALVFGVPLRAEQVQRRGISGITQEEIRAAQEQGRRIKLVASLRLRQADQRPELPVEARVEPLALPLEHPLARVDGVMNALTIESDTLASVTVIGPGAGRRQTAQGLLADLLAIARNCQT